MNALTEIKVMDAPKWVVCDSQSDVTDNWIERDGSRGNENEIVTAFFDHEICDHGDDVTYLRGISVDDGYGAAYYDRTRAIEFLGAVPVERIEEVQAEEVFS